MSWGSSQNTQTQQQNQQSGTSSNSTTPNLPPWLQQAFQGNVQQGQNLEAAAQQPVFGQAQTASYLQNLNQLANNSTQSLASNLASKGIEDSGALSQGATDIQTGKVANESGFLSQLPFQNTQAMLANEEGAMGAAGAAASRVPIGSTSTGVTSGQSSSTGSSDTQSNPGLAGLVSSLAGLGAGSLLGGGMGGATGGNKGMTSPQGGVNALNSIAPSSFTESSPTYQYTTGFGSAAQPFMPTQNPNG